MRKSGINGGTNVGLTVGERVVGVLDGAYVGWKVGCGVGFIVGCCDGRNDGCTDGTVLGELVGWRLGDPLGWSDGALVGELDGENAGCTDGSNVGTALISFSDVLLDVDDVSMESAAALLFSLLLLVLLFGKSVTIRTTKTIANKTARPVKTFPRFRLHDRKGCVKGVVYTEVVVESTKLL